MSRPMTAAIVLILVAASASAGTPDWQVGGPEGGLVWRVQVEDGPAGRVLATTTSGHFLSTDSGESWRRIWPASAEEFGDLAGWAILFHRGRIVRGTSRGIVTSEDGRTWSGEISLGGRVVSLGRTAGEEPRLLASLLMWKSEVSAAAAMVRDTDTGFSRPVVVTTERLKARFERGEHQQMVVSSPADPRRVRAFLRLIEPGQRTLVLGSDDGGLTWTSWWIPFEMFSVVYSKDVPDLLLGADSPFLAGSRGLIRSEDGGRTWKKHGDDPRLAPLRTLAVHPETGDVWLGTMTHGLLGLSGSEVRPAGAGIVNDTIAAIAVDPLRPERLFAGTQFGLYRSGDAGATWTRCSKGLAAAQCAGLWSDGMRLHHWEYTSGPTVSEDGGRTWSVPDPTLVEVYGKALDVRWVGPRAFLHARTADSDRFLVTENPGRDWKAVEGLGPDESIVGFGPTGAMYAAPPDLSLRRSADGKRWLEIVPALADADERILLVSPRGKDEVVAVLRSSVARLDESGGRLIARYPCPDDLDLVYRTVWPDPGGEDALFLTGETGSFYRLDLGTGRWTKLRQAGAGLFALLADPGRPAGRIAVFGSGELLDSVDGGRTWKPFEPAPTLWGIRDATITQDRKLALAASGGVLVLDLAALAAR